MSAAAEAGRRFGPGQLDEVDSLHSAQQHDRPVANTASPARRSSALHVGSLPRHDPGAGSEACYISMDLSGVLDWWSDVFEPNSGELRARVTTRLSVWPPHTGNLSGLVICNQIPGGPTRPLYSRADGRVTDRLTGDGRRFSSRLRPR